MAADHFCLKWNNYLSNMASELDMLRTEENLVDVTLCCEGYKFRAHKVILSACSPYFRNVFKENPCEHPVVILKDVLPEDVEALLSYVYQGIVYVSEVKLTSFLQTAELLQIKGLADAASSFIDGPTGANANADSNSVKRRKGAPCRIVKQEDGSAENNTNNQMEAENENANDFKDDFTDNNDDDGDDGEELESENSGDVTGVAYNNYQFKDEYSNPMTPGARSDSLSNLIHQTLRQQQQGNQFTPVQHQHQRSSSLGPTGVESQGQGSYQMSNTPNIGMSEHLSNSDRNGKRPCPQCTKVISNKSNLLKHIRIRHSDAYNPACCLLCNKMFKNKYSLRAHLNIYHKEYISPNAPQQSAPGAPTSAPATPEQPSPTGNYPVTPTTAAQQHFQSTIPT